MLNTRSERKIVNTKLKQMTDHKICLAFENMHDCCHRVQGFCTSKHPQTSLWTVFTHLLLHTGPHSQKLNTQKWSLSSTCFFHFLLVVVQRAPLSVIVICYCSRALSVYPRRRCAASGFHSPKSSFFAFCKCSVLQQLHWFLSSFWENLCPGE